MEIKTGAEILSEYRNQEQNLSTFKALEELIDEELEKAKSFPRDIPKQKAIRVDAEVIYDFGRNYTLDLEWAQKLEYNSAVLYEYEKYFVKELLVDNKKNITVHLYGKDGRNIWVSLSGIKILAQNSK